MSTELTTLEAGQSMLEELGMANLVSSGSSIAYVPRISLLQEPIMGTMDVGGKKIKTEVVPAGAFRINPDKDTTIYAEELSVRIFTIRYQYTRWDTDAKKTYKSVQATDNKGDLKDELGGFNLGKPGGYVADWNSLTKEQQSVRNATIYYGVAKLKNPVDDKGEPVSGYEEPIPFVMDVTSIFTKRALETALKTVLDRRVLPVNYELYLTHAVSKNKAGKDITHISVTGGQSYDGDDRDQETLRMFKDRIEGINKYVLSKWADANSNEPQMSKEDLDLVHSFVDVEEAD